MYSRRLQRIERTEMKLAQRLRAEPDVQRTVLKLAQRLRAEPDVQGNA